MSSKRSRVHPKYKTNYRVRNWPAYDRSLAARGDLTVWITPEALEAWRPSPTGCRGAQPKFSDLAIETDALVVEVPQHHVLVSVVVLALVADLRPLPAEQRDGVGVRGVAADGVAYAFKGSHLADRRPGGDGVPVEG